MRTIYISELSRMSKWKIKKITKKLYKLNKKEDIVIALSKNLENNEKLKNELEKFNLKILNGKWLFKFLLYDIIEYISYKQDKKMELLTVAILMEKQDEIVIAQLSLIAQKIKILKIVTAYINKFNYIEENLFKEYGIALQVTNNKKKSLSNVDIIINFDYKEEVLSEYTINKEAFLVNIENEIKNYEGININNYKITYNKEHFEKIDNKFNDNILYESYIYRKDTWSNIQKQLKENEVRLIELM